ncbi:hypothetical protein BDV93DRAFT_476208 [Ceratobasidium sp. AG-I]|nr:hypothetical protein BDV93DRAFT_476208 [Ceratobasidium sp. AG-I]
MLQNVIVAGARRAMSTSGIHLKKLEEIEGEKVMYTLMDLERAYATVGKSLLPEFFPNAEGLTDSETHWWGGQHSEYEAHRATKKPESLRYRRTPSTLTVSVRGEHNRSTARRA